MKNLSKIKFFSSLVLCLSLFFTNCELLEEAKPKRILSVAGDFNFGVTNRSASKIIEIKNTGDEKLTIRAIKLPANFSIKTTTPFSILPNKSFLLTIFFSSSESGLYEGDMVIDSDKTSGNNVFRLTAKINEIPVVPNPVDGAKVTKLMNDIRTKGCNCGGQYYPPVKPLKWNVKLANAAQLAMNGSSNGTLILGEQLEAQNHNYEYRNSCICSATDEEDFIKTYLPFNCKAFMLADVTDLGCGRVGNEWLVCKTK
jgi:hypothetical protein